MGESRGHISRGRQIRRTQEWRRCCATLKATRPWRCTYADCDCPHGRAIHPEAEPGSRWSWSADHIIELEDGGPAYDLTNLTPMHLRCNIRKGRKRQDARRYEAQRLRAHTIEARTMRVITHEIRGGGSNPQRTAPTKTPESWCPLSSRSGGDLA